MPQGIFFMKKTVIFLIFYFILLGITTSGNVKIKKEQAEKA